MADYIFQRPDGRYWRGGEWTPDPGLASRMTCHSVLTANAVARSLGAEFRAAFRVVPVSPPSAPRPDFHFLFGLLDQADREIVAGWLNFGQASRLNAIRRRWGDKADRDTVGVEE